VTGKTREWVKTNDNKGKKQMVVTFSHKSCDTESHFNTQYVHWLVHLHPLHSPPVTLASQCIHQPVCSPPSICCWTLCLLSGCYIHYLDTTFPIWVLPSHHLDPTLPIWMLHLLSSHCVCYPVTKLAICSQHSLSSNYPCHLTATLTNSYPCCLTATLAVWLIQNHCDYSTFSLQKHFTQ